MSIFEWETAAYITLVSVKVLTLVIITVFMWLIIIIIIIPGLNSEPILKCLETAFFITASRGSVIWLQKEAWLYRCLRN